MSTGLLYGCDEQIAHFVFSTYCLTHMKFDRALGVIDNNGKLVGGVLFQHWNGPNVEISYYGKGTMTLGVIRCLAQFGIEVFSPARCTVNTSKRNKRFIRALLKLGFKVEGVARCYYGDVDCARNTAVRLVIFRDGINRLARAKEIPNATSAAA